MKILFVDDDAIARKSMAVRIPWEKYGWELMYCAKDGVDALDYMKEHRPDVILTDIKMPVMDGIQMAVIAKDYYPEIKFVFLSGYKDFEYAKQALKLNAIDYLTKPVMADTLIAVMEKTQKLVLEEQKINRVVKEGYPSLQRHYISQLMYHNFAEADNEVFKAFDINLTCGFGAVGFVDFKRMDELEWERVREILKEICDRLTKEHSGSFFLPMEAAQIFFIYTASNTPDKAVFKGRLSSLEQEINGLLQERLGVKGSFYTGNSFQDLNQLYLSYQTAVKARNCQTTDILSCIRHYIEENYWDSGLTLMQIAAKFNINHCYLTSLYKEKFGINLYDYLIQVRMEKAGELLLTTSQKSYQVAEQVGYNNSQYFSLSFKKYFNCTVTEYKNKYSGKE